MCSLASLALNEGTNERTKKKQQEENVIQSNERKIEQNYGRHRMSKSLSTQRVRMRSVFKHQPNSWLANISINRSKFVLDSKNKNAASTSIWFELIPNSYRSAISQLWSVLRAAWMAFPSSMRNVRALHATERVHCADIWMMESTRRCATGTRKPEQLISRISPDAHTTQREREWKWEWDQFPNALNGNKLRTTK